MGGGVNDCVLVRHIGFRASSEKMGFFILEVNEAT